MMDNLYCGDCLDVMKGMPDNSVDSIVTDPPYGLSFMNKKWDYSVPKVEIWQEALRILKPGGHLLCFGGTRTQHRMVCNIEDAGFEIKNMLAWVFGSGFPKSLNVSKKIDQMDAITLRLERKIKVAIWLRSTGIKERKIDELTETQMGHHYLALSSQQLVPTLDMFHKFSYLLPEPPDEIIEIIKERTVESENFKKREIIGKDTADIKLYTDIGGDHTVRQEFNITASATEEAKRWDGFGSGIKPAMEPITLARKPLSEPNIASNVLKHGTGALNIDGCRVPINDADIKENTRKASGVFIGVKPFGNTDNKGSALEPNIKGRWPSNFIIDGSEEVEALFPYSTSGGMKEGITLNKNTTFFGNLHQTILGNEIKASSGSASRFFYCAKASKEDRGENNNHPTVKPISLMKYLVRLITPPDGTCIDPFMGSGSTGKACAYEGFKFIGIDLNLEYVAIAKARIEYALQEKEDSERQMELF